MKKVYIIGKESLLSGIGVITCDLLCACLYAKENNLIPIIDMQHYQNPYLKENRIYKDNAWEYFFKQPSKYCLNDIKEDDEVIIGNLEQIKHANLFYTTEWIPVSPKNENSIKKETRKNLKSFLYFSDETNNYILNTYNKIIGNKKNILGVLIRGTDYTERRTYKEDIQPKIKKVIKKIKEYRKMYPEIEYIYLATEDANIYNIIKKEFGDILLDNNQKRYSYDKEKPFLLEIETERENNNYYLALEYLSSLYILSKCKYFIGGRNNGSRLAYIMQDSWQDFYIWQLGRYGKTIKEIIFSHVTKRVHNKDYKIYNFFGLQIKKEFKNTKSRNTK